MENKLTCETCDICKSSRNMQNVIIDGKQAFKVAKLMNYAKHGKLRNLLNIGNLDFR